jgi:hypothetical protein
LVTDAIPTRGNLRLLTRVRFRDEDGTNREFFAHIIELGPRSGRIESARPLAIGSELSLQIVFPGQRKYQDRHVLLNYVVRKAHDEPNLLYDLEATRNDPEPRERLALFLNRNG